MDNSNPDGLPPKYVLPTRGPQVVEVRYGQENAHTSQVGDTLGSPGERRRRLGDLAAHMDSISTAQAIQRQQDTDPPKSARQIDFEARPA